MDKNRETEIIQHINMNYLEIFLVEMISRGPHGHDDLEIGILLDGQMTLYIEQKQYDLHAGDIYIINRYQVHSFSNTSGRNLILAFQISTNFYRRLNHQFTFLQFDNNIIRSGHLYQHLHSTLMDCATYYFKDDPYYELKCSSLIFEALYSLVCSAHCIQTTEQEFRTAQNNSQRISRIIEYISEHYMEKLTLDDIATLEGISPYHASHFITKVLGITFQECLANIRFEHALQLINKTDLNLLDICMETGFSSSKYLNQMFEKKFGCTAKEYKKSKDKPSYIENVLPLDNLQKRHSFEQSAFLFHKLQ